MSTIADHAPRQLMAGLRMLIVITVITGVVFPLAIWGIGQVALRHPANGSQVSDPAGRPAASTLLAQKFAGEQWFHPRPSANDYNTLATGGTNLGPNSDALLALIAQRREQVARENGVAPSAVPTDAVTASFSGLDPDISPAYARLQAGRIARVRGVTVERVNELIAEHTEGRQLGYLGEPRVNVVALNLALHDAK